MKAKPQKQSKAPYRKPELQVYGDIVTLTKNAANIGMFDNIVMKT